jgi:hypothetical protein
MSPIVLMELFTVAWNFLLLLDSIRLHFNTCWNVGVASEKRVLKSQSSWSFLSQLLQDLTILRFFSLATSLSFSSNFWINIKCTLLSSIFKKTSNKINTLFDLTSSQSYASPISLPSFSKTSSKDYIHYLP